MNNLDYLIDAINHYPSDIRAEVLVADLIREGFSQSDLLVFFDSLFKRGYCSDIIQAERILVNDVHEMLAIYLARDGMYDMLPEGLFHTVPDSALASGKTMAQDSKKESMLEEDARRFFLPFENEIFYQRIQLEFQEKLILQKLNDNQFDDFFLRFWKINKTLPKTLTSKLSIMLSFIRDIVGNFEMTANCLGAILGEEVSYSVKYSNATQNKGSDSDKTNGFLLGDGNLGVNFITGRNSTEPCKSIRFSIGPIEKTGVEPYLPGGVIDRFIDCFFDFFMPLEVDSDFEVVMPENLQHFMLGTGDEQPVLGYCTTI